MRGRFTTILALTSLGRCADPLFDAPTWPIPSLWSVNADEEVRRAVTTISSLKTIDGAVDCEEVHKAVQAVAHQGSSLTGLTHAYVLELMYDSASKLQAGGDLEKEYPAMFGEVVTVLRAGLEVAQLLSFTVMIHGPCFLSAARQALMDALQHMHAAVRQQVSTMWWMVDIGLSQVG